MPRRSTSTSNFGAGAREGHDASAFYARFRPPEISADDHVLPPTPIEEPFVAGDARDMHTLADGSVALVVTSPPYFAGKQYEEELEREGVPSSYLEYLQMLTEVFAECARVLEPGGRIAVNVANLGRKPYRSLASDVIRILEHDLGLLLRGELVWQKGEGATGSCAWGSFRSPSNPVLRDLTERVVVASKGRFDRARSAKQRASEGLPHESTIMAEDFMALTLDVWSIPPESAKRVGHPAPFPVELPEQLIRLYTYADDLVLDPFMGSGSALVAAARLGRRYVGYDLDPGYVDIARRRVDDELARIEGSSDGAGDDGGGNDSDGGGLSEGHERAARREAAGLDGSSVARLAARALTDAGFEVAADRRVRGAGTGVSFVGTDRRGGAWHIVVAGGFTAHRIGLQSSDVVWRTLGRAAAVRGRFPDVPFLVLTTDVPARRSDLDLALRAAGPSLCTDIVDLFDPAARERLARYAAGERTTRAGFWTSDEVTRVSTLPGSG